MIIICLKLVLTETCPEWPTPIHHRHILTSRRPFESWLYDRASGAYQKCRALSASWWEGRGLLINWPDGTETLRMGKNNDPSCEKADRVSQLWKFSRCTCIQTARLNQSGLHKHATASMIHQSGRRSVWLHWFPVMGANVHWAFPYLNTRLSDINV